MKNTEGVPRGRGLAAPESEYPMVLLCVSVCKHSNYSPFHPYSLTHNSELLIQNAIRDNRPSPFGTTIPSPVDYAYLCSVIKNIINPLKIYNYGNQSESRRA